MLAARTLFWLCFLFVNQQNHLGFISCRCYNLFSNWHNTTYLPAVLFIGANLHFIVTHSIPHLRIMMTARLKLLAPIRVELFCYRNWVIWFHLSHEGRLSYPTKCRECSLTEVDIQVDIHICKTCRNNNCNTHSQTVNVGHSYFYALAY